MMTVIILMGCSTWVQMSVVGLWLMRKKVVNDTLDLSRQVNKSKLLTELASQPFPLFKIIQSYTPSSVSPVFFKTLVNNSLKKS
jgi:hypothetical protein